MENDQIASEALKKLEEQASFTDDTDEIPPTDIVAYNELRSCADIVRMYESKQLDIQPDFQRDIVWAKPAQTRFIDSLIKQLPIPSMCISLDYKTDKRLVIDGLQRIKSIILFLTDDEWKLSELDDINPDISGKTVHTIKTKNKNLYTRVQNMSIPVTILRCDNSKKEHNEYLFTIFHRLNTGGNKLNNQEIRNCIYNGTFNTVIKSLAESERWVTLFGPSLRFSGEELILRFYTFYDLSENYNGKLAKFLNDYMDANRHLSEARLEEKSVLLNSTIDLINQKIESNLSSMSKTVLESLLIGVAKNLQHLSSKTETEVKESYKKFRNLPEFSVDSLKEGLSSKDKVINRIAAAIRVFSE